MGANRFAASTTIDIVNQCGHALVIDGLLTPGDRTIPASLDLPSGDKASLGEFLNLTPDENVKFLVTLAPLTN